ncbi:hypothetical protein G7Z17_g13747 [Cylindrodendrum hubeiense]|uniref:GLEYA adhesin domain-containing protein n=1 Tax=Cylindrodendrum hubeiense TaxID=595255 RepID=A0A9P5L7Y8_9HYPO|nr:hypothetical protein G7Z17_g13747 [Cylindrodendrum hubeiense]
MQDLYRSRLRCMSRMRDCVACPNCPQCDCTVCANCNDCLHCNNCKDVTCSNVGLNWAFWPIPPEWGTITGFSEEFNADYLKTLVPDLTGTWYDTPFPISAYCDSEGSAFDFLGQTVLCTHFAVQFRGYILADVEGDYTFTGGPNTDDNTIVWAGNSALYYTRSDAIVDIRYPDIASYTGTYTAQLGEYIPIRIICSQYTYTFVHNMDIRDPAGNPVKLLHSPCDETGAVQFPPWGGEI